MHHKKDIKNTQNIKPERQVYILFYPWNPQTVYTMPSFSKFFILVMCLIHSKILLQNLHLSVCLYISWNVYSFVNDKILCFNYLCTVYVFNSVVANKLIFLFEHHENTIIKNAFSPRLLFDKFNIFTGWKLFTYFTSPFLKIHQPWQCDVKFHKKDYNVAGVIYH